MNTNHDSEATRYQGTDSEARNAGSNDEVEVRDAKHGGWTRAAVGAAAGVLIGSVSTVLMGMKKADAPEKPEPVDPGKDDDNGEQLSHPEWVDGDIPVATVVDDSMSFGQAFASARAEVGSGGCFEWHGNVYSTHTAEEWNSMTPAERAEFNDHFSWNHHSHSSGDTAHHTEHHTAAEHADHTAGTAQTETPANADDDIEVVSVNHTEGHHDYESQNNHVAQNNSGHTVSQTDVVGDGEPEIEILGVVHDDESGVNIGGMTVDGQEIILLDVDGNMEFDYMASDLNGNGQVDQNELVDIQGQGLTVSDLGGFSNPAGEMTASNDSPDYSTDVYEG